MSTKPKSQKVTSNEGIISDVLALRCHGNTITSIADTLGISTSSVNRIIKKKKDNISITTEECNALWSDEEVKATAISFDFETNPCSEVPLGIPKSFVLPHPNKKLDELEIQDFIESLAPSYRLMPLRKPVVQTKPNNIALVIGDNHFGAHSQVVNEIFYQFVEELRPSTIILNGDTLDMFAVSKYPKDARYSCSLTQEREAFHDFIWTLQDITESYGTQILETNANHSGDGIEGRWWRYLSDRLGEVGKIPEVLDSLSYKNVFHPADADRLKLVDHVEIVPGFLVMHGDVVRKHAGASARGLFEKWFTSIIANHTHRMGMSAQRFPSIGSVPERIVRVYENGCACSLKPLYASAANWQNSFSIVNYDNAEVGVEQVLVNGNSACSTTLGKIITV